MVARRWKLQEKQDQQCCTAISLEMTGFAELATIYVTHYAKLGTGQYRKGYGVLTCKANHKIPEKRCDSKTLAFENLIGATLGETLGG